MMTPKNKGTRRTFHWWDKINIKRSIEIDSGMNIKFVYNDNVSMSMRPDEFDSLIDFVYSELKKRRLDQKEVKSANS